LGVFFIFADDVRATTAEECWRTFMDCSEGDCQGAYYLCKDSVSSSSDFSSGDNQATISNNNNQVDTNSSLGSAYESCATNWQDSEGGCYKSKKEYCEAVEDQEVCGVSNPAAGQTVVTNGAMPSSQGVLPAGTTIDTSTGIATTPQGKTVPLTSSEWTAVEENIASGGSGGLTMCANGILYSTCDGIAGGAYVGSAYPTGSAFTVLGNSNYYPGNTAIAPRVGGVTGPKCGVGFEEVSGVCFPLNTGLSTTSIYSILTNLFSWLMGLFTTFAVLAFVISGVQYLTSAGNEELAKTAKTNATNAILGIIVGLSGFIVVRAVAAALSGQGWFF